MQSHSSNVPICSVIIAAFNAAHFIFEAIESLQSQTLKEIEIIVVDDGSKDHTAELVLYIGKYDARIQLVKLAENKGQSSALNIGMEIARGKYIAFLDADDLALPNRIELQVTAMELDEELILCGGSVETIHGDNNSVGETWTYETSPNIIPIKSLFKSEFMTGTICLRNMKVMEHELFFDPKIKIGSDWELTIRAMKYGKVINLAENLICYRIHPSQMTSNLADDINTTSADIRRVQIEALGVIPTEDEMKVHLAVSPCNYWPFGSHPYFIEFGEKLQPLTEAWFIRLRLANKKVEKYSITSFNLYLDDLEKQIANHLLISQYN